MKLSVSGPVDTHIAILSPLLSPSYLSFTSQDFKLPLTHPPGSKPRPSPPNTTIPTIPTNALHNPFHHPNNRPPRRHQNHLTRRKHHIPSPRFSSPRPPPRNPSPTTTKILLFMLAQRPALPPPNHPDPPTSKRIHTMLYVLRPHHLSRSRLPASSQRRKQKRDQAQAQESMPGSYERVYQDPGKKKHIT